MHVSWSIDCQTTHPAREPLVTDQPHMRTMELTPARLNPGVAIYASGGNQQVATAGAPSGRVVWSPGSLSWSAPQLGPAAARGAQLPPTLAAQRTTGCTGSCAGR
jgi:hypothetical protein